MRKLHVLIPNYFPRKSEIASSALLTRDTFGQFKVNLTSQVKTILSMDITKTVVTATIHLPATVEITQDSNTLPPLTLSTNLNVFYTESIELLKRTSSDLHTPQLRRYRKPNMSYIFSFTGATIDFTSNALPTFNDTMKELHQLRDIMTFLKGKL